MTTEEQTRQALRIALRRIPPRPVVLTPPHLLPIVHEEIGTLSDDDVIPRVTVVEKTTRLFDGTEIYIYQPLPEPTEGETL